MKDGWNEIALNGARQWVSLRGDPAAPLQLFLQGVPAAPSTARGDTLDILDAHRRTAGFETVP